MAYLFRDSPIVSPSVDISNYLPPVDFLQNSINATYTRPIRAGFETVADWKLIMVDGERYTPDNKIAHRIYRPWNNHCKVDFTRPAGVGHVSWNPNRDLIAARDTYEWHKDQREQHILFLQELLENLEHDPSFLSRNQNNHIISIGDIYRLWIYLTHGVAVPFNNTALLQYDIKASDAIESMIALNHLYIAQFEDRISDINTAIAGGEPTSSQFTITLPSELIGLQLSNYYHMFFYDVGSWQSESVFRPHWIEPSKQILFLLRSFQSTYASESTPYYDSSNQPYGLRWVDARFHTKQPMLPYITQGLVPRRRDTFIQYFMEKVAAKQATNSGNSWPLGLSNTTNSNHATDRTDWSWEPLELYPDTFGAYDNDFWQADTLPKYRKTRTRHDHHIVDEQHYSFAMPGLLTPITAEYRHNVPWSAVEQNSTRLAEPNYFRHRSYNKTIITENQSNGLNGSRFTYSQQPTRYRSRLVPFTFQEPERVRVYDLLDADLNNPGSNDPLVYPPRYQFPGREEYYYIRSTSIEYHPYTGPNSEYSVTPLGDVSEYPTDPIWFGGSTPFPDISVLFDIGSTTQTRTLTLHRESHLTPIILQTAGSPPPANQIDSGVDFIEYFFNFGSVSDRLRISFEDGHLKCEHILLMRIDPFTYERYTVFTTRHFLDGPFNATP